MGYPRGEALDSSGRLRGGARRSELPWGAEMTSEIFDYSMFKVGLGQITANRVRSTTATATICVWSGSATLFVPPLLLGFSCIPVWFLPVRIYSTTIMGIPKFFRYISERYPLTSQLIEEDKIQEFGLSPRHSLIHSLQLHPQTTSTSTLTGSFITVHILTMKTSSPGYQRIRFSLRYSHMSIICLGRSSRRNFFLSLSTGSPRVRR